MEKGNLLITRATRENKREEDISSKFMDLRAGTDGFHCTTSHLSMGEVNEEGIKEIRSAFDIFDMDKDGRVSHGELRSVFRLLGLLCSEKDLDNMIQKMDSDGNGYVDYKEFEAYAIANGILEKLSDDNDDELLEAFKYFDKDGNGYIDREELKAVLTMFGDKMTEEEVDKMFHDVDTNGDGRIDYEEFCQQMTKGWY